MALDDDIRTLSGVSLFGSFTQDQLRLLAFGAESMRIAAGRDLYHEGEPADGACVVVAGTVGLFHERESGRAEVGRAEAGSLLGEFALIAETTHLTGAAALTDLELLKINRRLFRRILEEYPEAAAALHRRMVENFKKMVAEIERVGARFRD
ncbi:MAG: cyclic nucleotide-binding domain-containing protein [Rhizobiaceae bacterium]